MGLEAVLHKLSFPGVLECGENFKPLHFHFYDSPEDNFYKHIFDHLYDHFIIKYYH